MKKKFTFLIAAFMLLTMINLPGKVVGQVSTATATDGNSYVVAYYANNTYYALPQGNSANVWDGTEVTLNNINKVSTSDAEDLAWTLTEGTTSGTFYLTYGSGNSTKYLTKSGSTGNNNKLALATSSSNDHYWEFTMNTGNNNYTVKSLKNITSGTNGASLIYLGYANAGKFGVYSSTSAAKIILLEIGDEPTSYTITYQPGEGASGTPISDNNISGQYTVRDNDGQNGNPSFSKTGHNFDGWNNGTSNVAAGENINVTSDVTLTAQWTPETYTITYKAGFGDQPDIEETKTYNVAYTIADNIFDAPSDAHSFAGWKDSNNNDWAVGASYTGNAPLTLTAQWTTAAMYSVTYNCNGGESGCPNNASVVAGTQITLPAAPTREGYTFNGWLCSGDYGYYEAGAPYVVNTTVTFTAQWRQNLPAPTIQIAGVGTGTDDEYYHTVTITLSNEINGTTIRYTLDGTDPTSTSTAYTEPLVVTTEGETTIKAYATKDYYNDSPIAEATFTIVNRADATFTDGVYTTLNSENAYNTWYKYNKAGDQVWSWSSTYAKMTGYVNPTSYANEDWLISPKMHILNGKLAVSFDCVGRYDDDDNVNDMISAWYSTDYPGYGDPTAYSWTEVSTDPALPFKETSWTFISVACNLTGTDVYFALRYKSTTSEAGTFEVKNFSAKQCYPVTYVANGGSGTMTDPNSPYAVGAEVTVLANSFTAPEDKAFSCWNDGEDDIFPGNKFNMGTSAVTLTAQWVDICHTPATMAATTGASEYVNNSGTKSYKINLSSSVTALSDCVSGGAITSYGFVYSTENETPTVDNGTVIEKGNSYTTANVEFTDEIANATLDATYYIRSYATNTAGTAYGAKATVVIPAAYPTYTISYETNGVAEATTTTIFQGDAITNLLAAPAQAVPSGYTFMGWSASEVALTDNAPTFVKNGDAINSDLALKAVFAIQTSNIPATLTKMVTGDSFAKDDKVVVVAAVVDDINETTDYYGMYQETSGTTYVKNYSFTESAESVAADDKNWWTVTAGQTNGKWVLGDATNGYLYNSSNNNLAASTDNSTEWSLVDNEDGTFGLNNGRYVSCRDDLSGDNQYLYRMGGTGPSGVYKFTIYKFVEGSISYADYCTSVSGSDAITVVGGSITNNELTGEGTIAANTAVSITNLTIKSGATLTVNGAIATEGPDNLIIEDGGQLILPNNTTVAATVQKTTEASTAKSTNKWYAIASPVNDVAISSFVQGTHNVYRYDEENIEWEEYRNNNNLFTTLENGRGYLYRSTTANLAFAGDVNAGDENGEVNYDLSYAYVGTKTDFKGINLLGNPFTHNITWSNLETTNVETAGYYLLIEEGENQGKWSATASTTATIAPMQAFLVQAIKTDAKVTIKNSAEKGGEEKSYNDNIMFTVINGQQSDETYVFFKEGHGLNKIDHRNAEIPMLYVVNNGERFAIAEMPDNIKVINLGFKAMTFGKYTLSLKANGNFSYLHLIDKLTGEDVDMLLEDEYSFIASPSDNENRFIVRLNYSENYESSEIFAYQSGNDIVVTGEGELQIFDVMGRMVKTQHINGVETINVPTNGVYIFRLNEKAQKIVVE